MRGGLSSRGAQPDAQDESPLSHRPTTVGGEASGSTVWAPASRLEERPTHSPPRGASPPHRPTGGGGEASAPPVGAPSPGLEARPPSPPPRGSPARPRLPPTSSSSERSRPRRRRPTRRNSRRSSAVHATRLRASLNG